MPQDIDTDQPEPGPHAEELKRRMKAAMALAGITVGQLAERINLRNYGEKTLYNLQGTKGRGPSLEHEQVLIAKACGVSPAFFTVDFATLGETTESRTNTRLELLEAQIAAVAKAVTHPQEAEKLETVLLALASVGQGTRRAAAGPGEASADTGRPSAGPEGDA